MSRPFKNRTFLEWAKHTGGICCICRHLKGDFVEAQELHHYGEKGMGQKCSDYRVARLCRSCHTKYQGRRQMAFIRNNEFELWCAMLRDNVDLLEGWATK